MKNEVKTQDIILERVSKAKQILDVFESENRKMSTYFLQFALLIEETYKPKKTLGQIMEVEKMNAEGEPLLCGFPGTVQVAFNQLSEGLKAMNDNFHTMSELLKHKSLEFQKFPDLETKSRIKKTLEDTQQPINDLNMLTTILKTAEQNGKKDHMKALLKLNETVQSLMKKTEVSSKQKKQVSELWSQILEARKTTESQRLLLTHKANAALNVFRGYMNDFFRFSQNRIDHFTETLDVAMFGCMKVAALMQNTSGFIRDSADAIDFKSDMKSYVKSRGIVRYDIMVQPFKEFVSDTPAFQSIDSRVRTVTQTFDPIGFVQVIHSHRATNINEMSCKIGQRLLILEFIGGDWTFVMHPVTRVTGFIPTQCIMQIGVGLGVVLRKTKSDEIAEGFIVRPGEYVAVLSLQSLSFQTARGNICKKPPSNLIGIVFQN